MIYSEEEPQYRQALDKIKEMLEQKVVTCRGLKSSLTKITRKTVPAEVIYKVRAELIKIAYYIEHLGRPSLNEMIQRKVHLFNQLLKKQIFGSRFPWWPFRFKSSV